MSQHTPTTEYGNLFPLFILPVIVEDAPMHVAPYYFCTAGDPTCPCHEDPTLIVHVHAEVLAGLLTPAEATRIVQGQQIDVQGGMA